MLEKLRGQQGGSNNEILQDLQPQNIDSQLGTQPANVNITSPPSTNDNLEFFSSPNESQSQQKEDPLVVKIRGKSNI